jgi:hypothetical protein
VKRERGTVKDNIGVQDIEGTRPGTVQNGKVKVIKLGLRSKRVTNPVMPEYQALGRTEKDLRQDVVYAEPWKDLPMKKTNTRTKSEWKKSEVIPIINDTKSEVKKVSQSNVVSVEDVIVLIK